MDQTNTRKPSGVFLACAGLLILLATLLFYRLDGHLLWGDEAETAVLARNVTKFGVPKSFDGVNRITLFGAKLDENKDDVWIWSPWLQQYLAAASFKVFGTTTWAARFPFALCAWAAAGLLTWLAHRVYRTPWITIGTLLMLGTSEVFLLHARQCRYYGVIALAEVVFIYGIYQLLNANRRGAIALAGALIVLFYSNYIIAAANMPVVLVLVWNLWRSNRKMAWSVVISLGALALAAVPWLLYADILRQMGVIVPQDRVVKMLHYLREFNFHFVPWVFFLIPLIAWTVRKLGAPPDTDKKPGAGKKRAKNVPKVIGKEEVPVVAQPAVAEVTRRWERHLVLLFPLYLGVLLIPPGPHMRYLIPLLPAGCLLATVWLFRHVKWRGLAVALLVLQCASNLPAMTGGFPWKQHHTFRWPIFDFVGGLMQPYEDRLGEVVKYINANSKPGESIYVDDPEFPLMFHTQLKIHDMGVLGGGLPNPLPDWIFSESASGVMPTQPLVLTPQLGSVYETISLAVPNTLRKGGIPEPDVYQYRTATNQVPFVIYRKRAEGRKASGD